MRRRGGGREGTRGHGDKGTKGVRGVRGLHDETYRFQSADEEVEKSGLAHPIGPHYGNCDGSGGREEGREEGREGERESGKCAGIKPQGLGWNADMTTLTPSFHVDPKLQVFKQWRQTLIRKCHI